MPEAPERTALYDLYTTREDEGLPFFLDELYPQFLSTFHHLGTAGSCPDGGPGVFYGMWDFEDAELVRVIKWGAPQAPVATALYRLRDHEGELLYVGITDDLERRWKDHAKDKPWWPEVASKSTEWLPSRSRALTVEAKVIRAERPRYNVHHNGLNAA